jgi:hypothetical protein
MSWVDSSSSVGTSLAEVVGLGVGLVSLCVDDLLVLVGLLETDGRWRFKMIPVSNSIIVGPIGPWHGTLFEGSLSSSFCIPAVQSGDRVPMVLLSSTNDTLLSCFPSARRCRLWKRRSNCRAVVRFKTILCVCESWVKIMALVGYPYSIWPALLKVLHWFSSWLSMRLCRLHTFDINSTVILVINDSIVLSNTKYTWSRAHWTKKTSTYVE